MIPPTSHGSDSDGDSALRQAIQQNLRQMATQLGQPMDDQVVQQLYQEASDLVGHISPAPLTLARVAGALLVYRLPGTEAEELTWFKAQLQQCQDEETVEELIESISRTDAL
ncbi:hypothetical protein [Phormidesmis priestleyi]